MLVDEFGVGVAAEGEERSLDCAARLRFAKQGKSARGSARDDARARYRERFRVLVGLIQIGRDCNALKVAPGEYIESRS